MADISRLLLFTLLLYSFWLPSAHSDAAEVDSAAGGLVADKTEGPTLPHARPTKHLPPSHGERFIISLLRQYTSSGCTGFRKAQALRDSQSVKRDTAYCSDGERYIIDLLLPYFLDDCEGGANAIGTMQGEDYSSGESEIIRILSTYFPSDNCEEPRKQGILAVGQNATTVTESTAIRQVQSILLELFLLIFGVCLMRITL